MTMVPELKAEWVAALRSGEYVQGRGQLRDNHDRFCCLGVLLDVAGAPWERGEDGVWSVVGRRQVVRRDRGLDREAPVTITETTLLKVLDEDGCSRNGGTFSWSLPDEEPGKWTPELRNLIPCERGYHLVTARQMLTGGWFGPRVFVAEARGERVDQADKSVCGQVRLVREVRQWNERTARLFACLCAEHVLPFYEKQGDSSAPRECIAVARRYADGNATRGELRAARDAAWDAAGAAARRAAGAAAWAAAGVAARVAAWVAAGVAAGDAAGDAAWVAARVAARVAAGDAAWVAERDWQVARLFELFNAPGDWS